MAESKQATEQQADSASRDRLITMLARGPDHLAMSYGRAARLLLDSGQHSEHRHGVHLDVPTFYSVRHSVELALKDLLWAYHRNEVDQCRLDAATGEARKAAPLPDDVLKQLGASHDLNWLLKQTTVRFSSSMSPTRARLVARITEFEGTHADWSRYDEGRVPLAKSREARQWEHRFDRPLQIPVRELVEDLEIFLTEAVVLNFDKLHEQDSKSWSVLQDLALEGDWLSQQLYAFEGDDVEQGEPVRGTR